MNATAEIKGPATQAEILVQAVRPWMIIYRTRYKLKLHKGIHVEGLGETVAELEKLTAQNPEAPVGLITYRLQGNHHYVFYDLTHEREMGHFRLPEKVDIDE